MSAADAGEARRQREVLRALTASRREDVVVAPLGLRGPAARALDGVAAYLLNRDASAQRALASACPTVSALIGEADFARLAAEFWRDHPPLRGDLGEWGEALPGWLAGHPALAPWPWLADCARLDLAVHAGERAADASMDVASLGRLDASDADQCRLVLMPGTQLLGSAWPIARVYDAHRRTDAEAVQAFDEARAALQAGESEQVLVVREGWRAAVHRQDPASARFVRAVLDAAPLGEAVEAAAGTFDFAQWLTQAVARAWVKGVLGPGD